MKIFTHDYWHTPLGYNQVDRATAAARMVFPLTILGFFGVIGVGISDPLPTAQQPLNISELANSQILQDFTVGSLVCVGNNGKKLSVSLPVRDDSVLSDFSQCTVTLDRR